MPTHASNSSDTDNSVATGQSSAAVLRSVTRDSWVTCEHCDEVIAHQGRQDLLVTCTAFDDGLWTRLTHFHEACYGPAGTPYGPVTL